MPCNTELSDEMRCKVTELKNFSKLDTNTQLRLWKETFTVRRQAIRDQSTSDVMKTFPAYSNAFLVNKSVKIISLQQTNVFYHRSSKT